MRTVRHVRPIQIWNRIWRRLRLGAGERCRCRAEVDSALPEFEFLNVKGRPKGWNDPAFEKLWLYNLHYFDWLTDEKSDLILKWIRENPKGWGNGWEPYPVSLRIVNWVKWLCLGVGERCRCRAEVEDSLIEQARWLEKRLEYHLLANHLLANAKALVFAGAWLLTQSHRGTEGERLLKKGMDIYRKELPEQILDDGVHFERSAMYHCTILEDLLDCVWILEGNREQGTGNGEQTVELFRTYAEKMLAGLELLTGPDGKIAKFNDAAEGIAKTPAALRAYARKIGVTDACQRQSPRAATVRKSGFVRMEKDGYCLVAKFGEIGPSYQPGHAHADMGTFELWKDGRKIVGDTGCSTYVRGPVRDYERSTKAHNAVIVDGENSSEVWAAHRVARRGRILTQRRRDTESAVEYRDFRGFEICRTLKLEADGLHGCDEVRGKGQHEVEIRWHLPPGVGKDELAIECPGELTWEPCEFAEGWNVRKPGLCAVFRTSAKLPLQVPWSVKSSV